MFPLFPLYCHFLPNARAAPLARVPGLTYVNFLSSARLAWETKGVFAGSSAMRNRIDIDQALRCAITREIGEGLRASLREDELPASLKLQLDRLGQLDDQSQPIVPDPPSQAIAKTSAVRRL